LNRFRTFLLAAAVFAMVFRATPSQAQTVSIVSGNGQLSTIGFQQLVVKVTDNSGNPVPAGTTVNWSITGFANLTSTTTTTNDQGLTYNSVFPNGSTFASSFQSYTQFTVIASSGGSAATFTLTQGLYDPRNPGVAPAQVAFVSVPIGSTLTGQVGTSWSTPIQVKVYDQHGFAIPNVGVVLFTNQDPATGPQIACSGSLGAGPGVVLTDSSGNATCTPVFAGAPGSGQFQVVIGGVVKADAASTASGFSLSLPINYVVTAGVPGSIVTVSGTGQSVNAGQSIGTPLTIQVNSSAGTPLAGQTIQWTASPAGSANLSNTVTSTDTNGRASTGVTIPSSAPGGNVTVTATVASDPSKTATFTINIIPLITITGFTKVSGDNQAAPVGAAFGQPLVVQVTTSAGSAAGVQVQFSATGPVSLGSTTATTDANGRAQTVVTAGSVTGPATVTASVVSNTGAGSQSFSLTVLPPAPAITASSFVNAADLQGNSFSPCSLAAVVGSAATLGSPSLVSPVPGLPVVTNSARLTVSNVSAPIMGIAPNANGQQQITFQIPCETATGTASVGLNLGGGTTNVTLNIQAASPGVYQTAGSDGVRRAVLIRPDGSFVSLTNPARRGESVVGMFTGLGMTSPAVATNAVPAPGSLAVVQGTVVVGIAGVGVPVVTARLSEDLPGIYLVSFLVPTDIGTGNDLPFSIAVSPPGASAQINSATTKISVQ
jgi:uncharacterized protein (TIGR03437 family)